jgi:hypothetical protein
MGNNHICGVPSFQTQTLQIQAVTGTILDFPPRLMAISCYLLHITFTAARFSGPNYSGIAESMYREYRVVNFAILL